MQTRTAIDGRLWLLGEELYDKEKRIDLGDPRHGRMLRFLVDHAEQDLPVDTLYRGVFPNRTAQVDHEARVEKIMQLLWRQHSTLRECILSTSGGYIFHFPLELKPDYVRGKVLPSAAFGFRGAHRPRKDLVEKLKHRAFSGSGRFLIHGQPGIGKTETAKDLAIALCAGSLLYRYVLLVRYEHSLEQTLTALRTEKTRPADCQPGAFLQKLRLLQAQGQVLLIVDNMDITAEEFEKDQPLCQTLTELGIHLLFTSRDPLEPWFDGCSAELLPMEPEQLRALFRSACNNVCDQGDDRIDRLLRQGLRNNTYLTVLAGKLLNRVSFETLEKALLHDGAGTLQERVTVMKDGQVRGGSLMDHFRTLYTLSDLNTVQKQLLQTLCLVPAEGMGRKDFMDRAFQKMRQEGEWALAALEDGAWVNGGETVSLHPMVRALVLEDLGVSHPMRSYTEATAQALYSREYTANLMPQLRLALAAWELIEAYRLKVPEKALLAAQIASTYDTLTDYERSCQWSRRAVPLLDALMRKPETGALYLLALCYNVTGWALTHTKKEEALAASRHALTQAEALTEQALDFPDLTEEIEEKLRILLTKIRSNMAAASITAGDYEEAAARHEAVLAQRQQLWERYGSGECRSLLAASRKNLGTVRFHLAKRELKASWEHQEEAVKLCGESWSEPRCIAFHRCVGSLLRLLELWSDEEVREALRCSREEMLLLLLRRQQEALNYLFREKPLANELQNGYENTCRILFQAQQKGVYTSELMDAADRLWRLPISDLPAELEAQIRTKLHPILLLLDKLR